MDGILWGIYAWLFLSFGMFSDYESNSLRRPLEGFCAMGTRVLHSASICVVEGVVVLRFATRAQPDRSVSHERMETENPPSVIRSCLSVDGLALFRAGQEGKPVVFRHRGQEEQGSLRSGGDFDIGGVHDGQDRLGPLPTRPRQHSRDTLRPTQTGQNQHVNPLGWRIGQ